MTMIANGIWIILPLQHRHVAVVSPLQIRRVRSNQYEGITVLWLFRARKAPLHWDRMTWLQQPMTFVQGFVVYLVLAREHFFKTRSTSTLADDNHIALQCHSKTFLVLRLSRSVFFFLHTLFTQHFILCWCSQSRGSGSKSSSPHQITNPPASSEVST